MAHFLEKYITDFSTLKKKFSINAFIYYDSPTFQEKLKKKKPSQNLVMMMSCLIAWWSLYKLHKWGWHKIQLTLSATYIYLRHQTDLFSHCSVWICTFSVKVPPHRILTAQDLNKVSYCPTEIQERTLSGTTFHYKQHDK